MTQPPSAGSIENSKRAEARPAGVELARASVAGELLQPLGRRRQRLVAEVDVALAQRLHDAADERVALEPAVEVAPERPGADRSRGTCFGLFFSDSEYLWPISGDTRTAPASG